MAFVDANPEKIEMVTTGNFQSSRKGEDF